MKKIEFKTSKGEFVLVDLPNAVHVIKHSGYIVQSCSSKLDCLNKCNRIDNGDVKGFLYIGNTEGDFKLSEITEQQASEIVDSDDDYGVVMYQNYQTISMQYFDEQLTAIDSLHSLLKSKGVYLFENPYEPYWRTSDYMFAEQNTFYNPYIFKKI